MQSFAQSPSRQIFPSIDPFAVAEVRANKFNDRIKITNKTKAMHNELLANKITFTASELRYLRHLTFQNLSQGHNGINNKPQSPTANVFLRLFFRK